MQKISLLFFILWWVILLIISASDPFALYTVSLQTYLLISSTLFSFILGFSCVFFLSKKSNKGEVRIEQVFHSFGRLVESRLFTLFIIVASYLVYRYLLLYKSAILLNGVKEARTMRFYVGEVFKSTEEIFLYNYIIETFAQFVGLFIASSIAFSRMSFNLLLSFIFVYLYSSFGAGRFYLIEILFLFLFFSFYYKSHLTHYQHFSKKLTRLNRLSRFFFKFSLFVGVFVFSVYISNFRNGVFELDLDTFVDGSADFLEQSVVYCIGSFRALDYGILRLSPNISLTWGALGFGGLEELLANFLTYLGINFDYSNEIYGLKTSDMFSIGASHDYNALFTFVFPFFLDFGYVGIFILPFLWGIVFATILGKLSCTRSIYYVFFGAYIFVVMCFTVFVWKLQTPSVWLLLIIMFLKSRRFRIVNLI